MIDEGKENIKGRVNKATKKWCLHLPLPSGLNILRTLA
jgi:hypothetical protein